MDMKLSENIRRFRKERSLTQEQLAEVLGVTAGAVYKWEAQLSVPELSLIVEMADFFDTSVDVLLGYEMKDNRLDETVRRLKEYRRTKDRAGLAEAEKALKKYPHSFAVVKESANLYRVFGVESGSADLFRRTLELLEQALLLLPQNTDPEINEQTLYGNMAEAYLGLGDAQRAVDLLKANNAGGMFNHELGRILAESDHMDDAMPYLSEALVQHTSALVQTIVGYVNVYCQRGDYSSAQAILCLGTTFLSGLKDGEKTNYFDKISCVLLAPLAWTQLRLGHAEEARETLEMAKSIAERFDADPSYEISDLRFVTRIEGASAHDDLGVTAMESLENVIPTLEDEEFSALWVSVRGRKESDNRG